MPATGKSMRGGLLDRVLAGEAPGNHGQHHGEQVLRAVLEFLRQQLLPGLRVFFPLMSWALWRSGGMSVVIGLPIISPAA